ncbi:MAG: hypothetical protein ACI89E_002209, partial [Planctomycetota bacterium]
MLIRLLQITLGCLLSVSQPHAAQLPSPREALRNELYVPTSTEAQEQLILGDRAVLLAIKSLEEGT